MTPISQHKPQGVSTHERDNIHLPANVSGQRSRTMCLFSHHQYYSPLLLYRVGVCENTITYAEMKSLLVLINTRKKKKQQYIWYDTNGLYCIYYIWKIIVGWGPWLLLSREWASWGLANSSIQIHLSLLSRSAKFWGHSSVKISA